MGSLKKFYPIIAWKWKTNDEGFGYDKERKNDQGERYSISFKPEELISVHKRLFPYSKTKYSTTEYMMTKLLYEVWKEMKGDWEKIQGRFIANIIESIAIIQGPSEIMKSFIVYYKVPKVSKWKSIWVYGYSERDVRNYFYYIRKNKQERIRKIEKKEWIASCFRISEFEFTKKEYF